MARTSEEFVDGVWYRISKGKPQPMAEVWRAAIQSTLDPALQRVADQVAADDGLYPLLVNVYDLILVGGEVAINALTPTLLISQAARRHWRVTMTDVRFPLKYRPHRGDLDNLPPTQDYYFYTIYNNLLVVRKPLSDIPDETEVLFAANKVPPIDDPAFDGELFDNLCDVGMGLILESGNLSEVLKRAEMGVGETPTPAAA